MEFRIYWGRVVVRAFRDTLKLMGWGSSFKVLAFRTGMPLAAIIGLLIWAPEPIGKDEMFVRVFLLGATIGTFLLLLAAHFVATPHKLDRELRDQQGRQVNQAMTENAGLRQRLTAREKSFTVATKLEEFTIAGTELRECRVDSKEERQLWKNGILKWCEEAEIFLSQNLSSSESYGFSTISTSPDIKYDDHQFKQIISARVQKLRLITMRYLSAAENGQPDTQEGGSPEIPTSERINGTR